MQITPVSATTRTTKVRAKATVESPPRKASTTLTVSRKTKDAKNRATKIKDIEVPPDNAAVRDQIATAAYFIAAQRGFTHGNELDDWLRAEQQVMAGTAKK